ncbi:MAG: galactonate dehydratase [Thermomicrobiales bacterium]|jgi:galactonate dehydratase|nr:galactonate dehydratase [Thermomicrobiales bacterium]
MEQMNLAGGRPDLKLAVTDVIPHVLFGGRTNLIFVEVRTDAGITGVGEASLEGKTEAVVGAINDVKEYLIGQDPTRIEHHWQTIYRHSFWRGGVVIGSAISGIEQALWDILGKALGVPVYELLGGRVRDRVRLYANGPRGETPEEVAESCVRLVEAGWGALKLAPFEAVTGVAGQPELKAARRQMQLIRDAVGPDVDVLIDCHGRLSPTSAVQMADALEEFDIFFFEEPVLPEDPAAMAHVAASISIPVATGERLFTKWGFRDILALGAADVLQPDLAHCGGIWEGRKIAAAAEVSYVGVAPHNPYSWLLTMASVQLDLATPNFLIQEFLVDHPPEVERLFAERFTWLPGGWVEPPTAPGLGVELDWEAVRAHEQLPYTRTYQPSLWHVDGSVADW